MATPIGPAVRQEARSESVQSPLASGPVVACFACGTNGHIAGPASASVFALQHRLPVLPVGWGVKGPDASPIASIVVLCIHGDVRIRAVPPPSRRPNLRPWGAAVFSPTSHPVQMGGPMRSIGAHPSFSLAPFARGLL